MVSIRQASLCAELGVRCGAASGGARRSGPPPAGASGPRVRLRAEGAPWCSGPAPAARAAPRPFLAAVRDLQGNRRCSCPGGAGSRGPRGRGGRSPRAAAASAPPRAPPPGGTLHCSGRGRAPGGSAPPTPHHPRRAGPCGPWLGPPPGPGGGRRCGARGGNLVGRPSRSPAATAPRGGARARHLRARAAARVPSAAPALPGETERGRRWAPRVSAPGGGNRMDATVWGFNIQHGKNARKLYSIFPVKVIILHRTKRKKSGPAGSAQTRLRPALGLAPRGQLLTWGSG